MSNETTKNRPTHRIYCVTQNGEEKARWTELGVAFAHRDGKGFDLLYNAAPIGGGKIVLRQITARPRGEAEVGLNDAA